VCNIRGEAHRPKITEEGLPLEIAGTPQFVILADVSLCSTPGNTAPEKK
jgi:hypothetical protein